MPNQLRRDVAYHNHDYIAVSTIEPDGNLVRFHETAAQFVAGKHASPWVVVESYRTQAEALEGHARWLGKAKTFPYDMLATMNLNGVREDFV